jgi:hypothetical protein
MHFLLNFKINFSKKYTNIKLTINVLRQFKEGFLQAHIKFGSKRYKAKINLR